jgi:adenine C2-methylase RlmN of 23S rRNA A2503 and tRNA A37
LIKKADCTTTIHCLTSFYGDGEPLMNYNNLLKAIEMITSPEGLGMSPKRIMVSPQEFLK